MRYLGIDYGSKRVGLAVSDDEGQLAFPFGVMGNDDKLVEKIKEMTKREEVKKIVIGESKDFKGRLNPIMEKVELFTTQLRKKSDIEIVFEPEFMTSVQAKKIQPENEMHDASAAALILQSYLDRQK